MLDKKSVKLENVQVRCDQAQPARVSLSALKSAAGLQARVAVVAAHPAREVLLWWRASYGTRPVDVLWQL